MMYLVVPVVFLLLAVGLGFVERDVRRTDRWLKTTERRQEQQEAGLLLTCKGVEVAYDQVQVLFGVDLEVRAGETVALLGTNGAGKSTLLNAMSGTVGVKAGSIIFDGHDITDLDGTRTSSLGIAQVPGGKAVFPTLTVAEHLRVAGWLYRDDPTHLEQATRDVYEMFPRLYERRDQLAGNLSGGEQQMLGLGMAFIGKPRLLVIDELSLCLAPTIVEELLEVVRRIQATGVSIIIVEQSINVALTIADRAYFLEKGEVRFEGPTAELIERDDIVRSVFLKGAASDDVTDVHAPVPPAAAGAPGSDGAHAPAGGPPALLTGGNGLGSPGAGGEPILELEGLVKRFGGITAVDGTHFSVDEGQIVGLIGANGAGKTTIFDLISGFERPDEGRIILSGIDVTPLSPYQRAWLGLGRSFQDARLVPSLTVAENLAIGLERHLYLRDHLAALLNLPGVVEAEEDVAWSVADLIELMNLGAFRDKFVRELSTGSRRIVDLAMCIAHEPRVLLLDEPSSGIAQREAEALGPLLKRIQRETGCALLVVEHDMPLITAVSDRMIALEVGSAIAEGTPEEVTSDPRVVAAYLGGDPAAVNRSGAVAERDVRRPAAADDRELVDAGGA
jgi:ABC-type branched-subunit amino acid transport system ATPase component